MVLSLEAEKIQRLLLNLTNPLPGEATALPNDIEGFRLPCDKPMATGQYKDGGGHLHFQDSEEVADEFVACDRFHDVVIKRPLGATHVCPHPGIVELFG